MHKTSILKKASADVKVVSELMQGWKKGRSNSKIEPRERRAKIEVCKILAWSR